MVAASGIRTHDLHLMRVASWPTALSRVDAGAGLEPATFSLWDWRATNCSTPQYLLCKISFFILHIYYNIYFKKNQKRFFGASSGTWTHKMQVLNLPRMPIPSPRHNNGGPDVARTRDPLLARQVLSQNWATGPYNKIGERGSQCSAWAASSCGGVTYLTTYLCTDGVVNHPLL